MRIFWCQLAVHSHELDVWCVQWFWTFLGQSTIDDRVILNESSTHDRVESAANGVIYESGIPSDSVTDDGGSSNESATNDGTVTWTTIF